MITGINQFKISTKHASYECKCNFDGRKCNSSQKMNVNVIVKIKKNIAYVKRGNLKSCYVEL